MESKYLHVKSCKYLLYKQLERKVRILFHWINSYETEIPVVRNKDGFPNWQQFQFGKRHLPNWKSGIFTCKLFHSAQWLPEFMRVNFWIVTLLKFPNHTKKSCQELTPNYSSIIKAGGVLMQRTVRDLFALWSSALAVVSVWVQLWCPPLMVAHNTFETIDFEESNWWPNAPKTRLFSSKAIWM